MHLYILQTQRAIALPLSKRAVRPAPKVTQHHHLTRPPIIKKENNERNGPKFSKKRPKSQISSRGRKTENIFINGLIHKQSSKDSRAFPPGNHFLHAFMSSLPLILASYIRLVTFLSYINNVHNSMIAVQS